MSKRAPPLARLTFLLFYRRNELPLVQFLIQIRVHRSHSKREKRIPEISVDLFFIGSL